MSKSKLAYFFCLIVLGYFNLVFYPKWEKTGSEATLSWDVCGYYYYLPAFFIYKDPSKVAFHTAIDEKYSPQAGDFYSAAPSESGNWILKYPCGMAIMYAPAFAAAHFLATPLGFAADGFSPIYQFFISFWSLLWAFAGLWYVRKVLLKLNFTEGATSAVLLTFTLATNYLEYAAVTTAMTHNYIFTLYAILLWLTIHFYENPTVRRAVGIGICVGLAALARPTELLIVFVPAFWGVFSKKSLIERLVFFKKHLRKVAAAAIIGVAIGSIQLIYWKIFSGHFIYDSYGKSDFMEWRTPHILDGLFSARRGWLVYSPAMLFSVVGFWQLWRTRRDLTPTLFIFFWLFVYVSFSHNIWWYGGSLGQRQMIQIYPLLALPLAAFCNTMFQNFSKKIIFGIAATICIYLNFWLMWTAHKPNGFWRDDTSQAYLRATIGRFSAEKDVEKLLDNKYNFIGERRDVMTIYENDFESDSSQNTDFKLVINGRRSIFVDKNQAFSKEYSFDKPLSINGKKWLRASATFRSTIREWTVWRMPQFILEFKNGKSVVRTNILRPDRLLLKDNETQRIWLDAKIPKTDFNQIVVRFWSAGSDKKLLIDDLKIELFND